MRVQGYAPYRLVSVSLHRDRRRKPQGPLVVNARCVQKSACARCPTIDCLVVVAVPPLIGRSDQDFDSWWQTFRFVEQAPESGAAMFACRRQAVNGVVQGNDLTREKFAVPVEWLSNSSRLIDRLRDNARCLLRPCTRPTLSFGLELHTELNALNSAARNRLKNDGFIFNAMLCAPIRIKKICLPATTKLWCPFYRIVLFRHPIRVTSGRLACPIWRDGTDNGFQSS